MLGSRVQRSVLKVYKCVTCTRLYWHNMDSELLAPSAAVRGMRDLQREAFRKRIQVPRLHVKESNVNKVLPLVKKLLLKMEHMRPVRVLPAINTEVEKDADREILLHPLHVKSWESLPMEALNALHVDAYHFHFEELELNYDNWRADEIFKSVLPKEDDGLTSYSRIGHIVHLNLREHLLPYKNLIGQVLLDKVHRCRTVVNKAANIDNTYRNFEFELICGEANYEVETKENGISFSFDFSKVYWNPRLSTEHERIVQILQPGDVLYDVFAGVGPFSVPAARKGCFVLANDLNPESYRWLEYNAKKNKCLAHIKMFNKDGRDFILSDVKADLLKRLSEQMDGTKHTYTIHITMNLPAMAVEFLNAFRGLFVNEVKTVPLFSAQIPCPIVHVYCFGKGKDTKSIVHSLVEKHLDLPLKDNLIGIYFVRNVAPNKDMYRVSFHLTKEILTQSSTVTNSGSSDEGNKLKRSANDTISDEEILQSSKLKC